MRRFGFVLGRASVALTAAVVLVSTTSFPELLQALRQLRLPAVVTTALGLGYRLLYLLVDEIERLQRAAQQGGNAFMDIQVPEAIIALRQGVGRLIRDVEDRGVLVLCDPRLTGKSYGKVFLKSLPPMRRVIDTTIVKSFLEQL